MLTFIRYAKVLGPLVIIAALCLGSYNLGVGHTEAKYAQQLLEARQAQDKLVVKLEAASKKITEEKTSDVKTIYIEKDPTGCADTPVPDGMLQAIIGGQPSPD